MSKLKDVLNQYSTSILYTVFILSFLIRLHEFNIFKDFNSDKARQLHGVHSLINGKGLNYVSYDLNSFEPLTKPLIDWPPAYPYIIIGIVKLTGAGIYTSSLYFDYSIELLLWLTLLWLCSLAGLSKLQQILFFIFVGCSKTLLQPVWSSDMAGTTFFLLSCALNVWFIRKTEARRNPTWLFFVAQFIVLFAMLFMKYSLAPALFAICISLGSYYFAGRNKKYIKAGVILTGVAVACIGILFLYNQSMIGHNTGLTQRHGDDNNALHFENLRFFYPYILDGIFYLGPFSSRLNATIVNDVALCITLLMFVIICITIIKAIRSKTADFFSYLTLLTMVFVTGFLVLLSVKFKRDVQNDGISWTYVKEFRYYIPAIFLIIIYLFRTYDPFRSTGGKTILRFLVLPAVIYAGGLWAYYSYIGNRANSFEALYGRVFKVADEVKAIADKDTYFVSLTGDMMFDAQVTSRVAIEDIKVAMSYYSYFPDSTYNAPFRNRVIAKGKKIIYYLGDNKTMLDSLSAVNNHSIETTSDGQQFLVIKN